MFSCIRGDLVYTVKHVRLSKEMFDADPLFEIFSLEWKFGTFKDKWLEVWRACGRPSIRGEAYQDWPQAHFFLLWTQLIKSTPGLSEPSAGIWRIRVICGCRTSSFLGDANTYTDHINALYNVNRHRDISIKRTKYYMLRYHWALLLYSSYWAVWYLFICLEWTMIGGHIFHSMENTFSGWGRTCWLVFDVSWPAIDPMSFVLPTNYCMWGEPRADQWGAYLRGLGRQIFATHSPWMQNARGGPVVHFLGNTHFCFSDWGVAYSASCVYGIITVSALSTGRAQGLCLQGITDLRKTRPWNFEYFVSSVCQLDVPSACAGSASPTS